MGGGGVAAAVGGERRGGVGVGGRKPGRDGEGHADAGRFPPEVDRCHVCCGSCARERCRPAGQLTRAERWSHDGREGEGRGGEGWG